MSGEIPRLRMFAGPNGSGKCTLKTVLPRELLGVYVNPDEIELAMRTKGIVDLHEYRVVITEAEIKAFFGRSAFNSGGQERTWLAEITDGKEMVMRTGEMPAWFKHAVWDRIST